MDDKALVSLFEESIRASDRTTHAIRALAKFIVYEAAYSLAVAFLVTMSFVPVFSSDGPFWWLLILAGLLSRIGLGHSLSAAFRELKESEIKSRSLSRILQDSARRMKMEREQGEAKAFADEDFEAFEKKALADRKKYEG